jgi:predicted SAM-dependent methyltransferase
MIEPMLRQWAKHSLFLVGLVKACRQLGPDWRRLWWVLNRRKAIAAYLRENPIRKLHLGSGKVILPGWLNTDWSPRKPEQVYLDVTRRFPLPGCSVDCVFSEHLIEHLWYGDAQFMLRECHRVLKPGGRIRIATPNLKKICELASDQHTREQEIYLRMATIKYVPVNQRFLASFVINNFFWDFGHYFCYDPKTLEFALTDTGFDCFRMCRPAESSDPDLCGIESHGDVVGSELDSYETMICEATACKASQR